MKRSLRLRQPPRRKAGFVGPCQLNGNESYRFLKLNINFDALVSERVNFKITRPNKIEKQSWINGTHIITDRFKCTKKRAIGYDGKNSSSSFGNCEKIPGAMFFFSFAQHPFGEANSHKPSQEPAFSAYREALVADVGDWRA